MPELPEVETVLRTLEHRIQNRKITDVRVIWKNIIVGDTNEFSERLINEHFRGFRRRGKYLIFEMDHLTLAAHLRMEGKFYIQNEDEPISKHVHVIFCLDDHTQLRYHDTRKFGRMEILPYSIQLDDLHGLGPEPFDDAFSDEWIRNYIKGRSVPVKTLLLEQSLVAGIGNIYADEILHACGIRPGRSCRFLSKTDRINIVSETRRILSEAILAGGTTIRSYTSSLGVTGRFQLSCKVHTMKNCGDCGNVIKVKWIGGRSSYYCPVCQKR